MVEMLCQVLIVQDENVSHLVDRMSDRASLGNRTMFRDLLKVMCAESSYACKV